MGSGNLCEGGVFPCLCSCIRPVAWVDCRGFLAPSRKCKSRHGQDLLVRFRAACIERVGGRRGASHLSISAFIGAPVSKQADVHQWRGRGRHQWCVQSQPLSESTQPLWAGRGPHGFPVASALVTVDVEARPVSCQAEARSWQVLSGELGCVWLFFSQVRGSSFVPRDSRRIALFAP